MSEQRSEGSEYDVVSLRMTKGTVSTICGAAVLGFGIIIDDLPWLLPAGLRRYLASAVIVALATAAGGLLLGILGLRQPEGRGMAWLGILLNGIVLLFEGLFVLAFRWIMAH